MSYFSIALMKHHTPKQLMDEFILTYSSRRNELVLRKIHDTRQARWQEQDAERSCMQRENWKQVRDDEPSKPTHNDILPPTRYCLFHSSTE